MTKYNFYLLSLFVLVSILLSACKASAPPFECSDAIGCVDIAPGEPIKLGVLQTLSGKVAAHGIDQTRGIELALARRENQLLGHRIELQIENERCSSEGGTIATLKIVADPQVVAILGTTCSGAATTATKIMSKAGLTMISGANTAPSLTSIGGEKGADWQQGYFRTIYSEAIVAQAAATFVFQKLGVKKVATINDGDAYTRGYKDVFKQAFTDLGGEVVLDIAVNKGDKDMRPVLTAVAASGAELVFFPLFQPEADFIVLQAKEVAGLENTILMGGGALLSDAFVKSVARDGVGMYMTGPVPLESPAFNELALAYKARYGEVPHTVSFIYAYDAANLLLNAIETVAVRERDGTLHIGRQALRKALYAISDFEGVTGPLTCDEFGDCSATRFVIVRLEDPTAGIEGLISNVIYTYKAEQ
jgi:branched-chain amino acid transport system substrate-binding protein